MEYLYIFGIIAYYLYKAYSKSKKKKKEPVASPTTKKKKKGLFDEILEEIEKAQNPKKKTVPTPTPSSTSRRNDIQPTHDIRKKKSVSKPLVSHTPHEYEPLIIEDTLDVEGERTTIEAENILQEAGKKPSTVRKFGKMNMSPKNALKAQIILERKF